MKYASKTDFLSSVNETWARLLKCCSDLSDAQLSHRQKTAGDGLDWSPKDVCGHVHAWHRLLLEWYVTGQGGKPDLPAKGYNWRETPALNRKLYLQFRDVEAASLIRRMKLSHRRIINIVDGLSNRKLMTPGHFEWTGKLALISYVSANTDSHYRWAINKIKRICR